MTIFAHRAAIFAALPLLTFAACSPAPPPPAAAAASASTLPTAGDPAVLPQSCRALLASMQSCSDNLAHSGSPLAESARGRITDMHTAISGAPPEERASFCDTQAGAFNQLAQTYHCQ
jgi:hypothetical protein